MFSVFVNILGLKVLLVSNVLESYNALVLGLEGFDQGVLTHLEQIFTPKMATGLPTL